MAVDTIALDPKRVNALRLLQATVRGRLATGAMWNVIGAASNQGSTFLLGIVLANMLGRELYGAFGFLQATLLMFSNVAQLALGFVATKFVAELRVADKARAGRVIAVCVTLSAVMGLAAAGIAAGAAPAIAGTLAKHAALQSVIRIGSPTILFIVAAAVMTGVLAGLERFRSIALIGIVSGAAYIVICTAGALRWTLNGVAAGLAVSAAVQAVLLLIVVFRDAAKQQIRVPAPNRAAFREQRDLLLHTALPAALGGFSTIPTLWLITAILARQSNGMSQLALFSAANSLRLLVNTVPGLINGVALSVLSSHKGARETAMYWKMYRTNVLAVAGIAFMGAAVLAAAAPWILRIYGRSFVEGTGVVLILLAATVPEALAISIYQVIQTHGSMWLSLFVSVPRDLTAIVLALLLTPRYGAKGLAFAVLGGVLMTLLTVIVAVRWTVVTRMRAQTA